MAWMDCSRALLKDFIELCKSAKKKKLVHSSILFYFLTSSHLDCSEIDPIALPLRPPLRYRILLSLLLLPPKALLLRCLCLPHAAADFIVKLPLSKLSHHRSFHRLAAGSAFLVALPLPSSWHCFRHCAAARFIVAPPLPSSLRCRFCLCHRAAAVFVIAPPPVLHLSSHHRWFCICRCAAAAFLVAPLLPLS